MAPTLYIFPNLCLDCAGDGFCNKGVLNTEAFNYDEGDCCYQTCTPTDLDALGDNETVVGDAFEWEIACAPWSFECRNPAVTDVSSLCNATGAPTADTFLARPCPASAAGRLGNGLCDQELNYAECDYDLGDCCMATCRYNAYVQTLDDERTSI